MNKHTVVWEGVREQCVLVSGAISSCVRSLVGPGVKLKSFIAEDGNGMITRSIVKILDNLGIEGHPVGVAYKQLSEGYLIYVGESGLCTLLTLLGLLVNKGDSLEKKGIPLINVLEGFRTAANVCEAMLHSIAIPFSSIPIQPKSSTPIELATNANNNNSISYNDENETDMLVQNTQFIRFHSNAFVSPPKVTKNNTQLSNMLSKLGIETPPVIPEMDDVSWFFEGDGDMDENTLATDFTQKMENGTTLSNFTNLNSHKEEDLSYRDSNPSNDILEIIGCGLAHGNEDMMAIAVQVARILQDEWEMTRIVKIEVDFEHASVTNGLILPLRDGHSIVTCSCKSIPPISSTNLPINPSIGQEMSTRQWCGRIVVLDGDAGDFDFYNQASIVREIRAEDLEQVQRQRAKDLEKYHLDILSRLEANNVKLVIASGEIKQSLAEMLHSHGIHTLDSIHLRDKSLTQLIPIGDLSDIHEDFLSPLLRIEVFSVGGKWKENIRTRFKASNLEFKAETYLRITCLTSEAPPNFPITVVVGGATKAIREDKERQMMNCLHKLRNSCQLQKVLPGGGYAEMRCMAGLGEHAKKMILQGSTEPPQSPTGIHYLLYEAEAVKGFSECIEEYLISSQEAIDTILKLKVVVETNTSSNIRLHIPSEELESNDEREAIYDDMLAKIEGLQRAVLSTSIILNINTMITEQKNLVKVK